MRFECNYGGREGREGVYDDEPYVCIFCGGVGVCVVPCFSCRVRKKSLLLCSSSLRLRRSKKKEKGWWWWCRARQTHVLIVLLLFCSALHDAVERGDVDEVERLLAPPEVENGGDMGGGGMVPEFGAPGGMGMVGKSMAMLESLEPPVDVNKRDEFACTPLHVAILHGRLECVEILLEHGARATQRCEGALPLHMAVCVASLPQFANFGVAAVKMLVNHGCIILDRDDHGRTPLHWAAAYGLVDVCKTLIDLGKDLVVVGDTGGEESKVLGENPLDAPPVWEFQDRQGNTAAHLAARYGWGSVLELLLEQYPAGAQEKNKSGLTVAHMAAIGGDVSCATAIMVACPDVAQITNRQKRTAAALAEKRGNMEVASIFKGEGHVDVVSPKSLSMSRTLIVAPPECREHHTAPWPIERSDDPPPPENVNRLTVLTDPEIGSLRTVDFIRSLQWDEKPKKAPMADILRVHDWAYVLKLRNASESITSSPTDIRHLDGDTAISHGTFRAALAAVGAVCHAIDQVVMGKAKNAFCPVRPPGHHAGPHGVVTSRNDPNGSHGFCLLNNIAIGAAYAMNVHRHAGIRKVAILDFDVHHGNGTEACVTNTAASLDTFEFATPYGKGTQTFPVYKPWFDESDKECVFFASVQGYGPKAPGIGSFVYPGSGATCDTEQMQPHNTEEINELDKMQDSENSNLVMEEDPEGEFKYTGGEVPRAEGPRIIDVGIPGPGAHVPLWKRSWRDKIIPALIKFEPDLILVSAGFDAHKKDDINFSYIGIQEKDFEWITDQIVQVANRCCHGRIVSVLEGGYRIHGNIVSAFARSVAAHVRALAEPNLQEWDHNDAKWEREREKRLRQEAEAKRAAELDAAHQATMAATLEPMAPAPQDGDSPTLPQVEIPALNEPESEGGEEEMVPGGRQKRRRSNVDYVALNKKLEEEKNA